MKKIITSLFVLLIFVIASAETSYACSCVLLKESVNKQVKNAYQGSTAIFEAEVLEVRESTKNDFQILVKVRISKSWKGGKTDEIITELGKHLGMFTVDKKKKVLRIFDKSGCCWHVTEEYSVVNNRPVKVFVEEEDATFENGTDGKKVKITTKTLVKGKWQTKVKFVKREEN